jgi:hypothetical protein
VQPSRCSMDRDSGLGPCPHDNSPLSLRTKFKVHRFNGELTELVNYWVLTPPPGVLSPHLTGKETGLGLC